MDLYPRAERRHRSTVLFVKSEHKSHHFLVFLLLTYNSLLPYKLLHRFFLKRCCQVHVQAKKK